MLKLGVNVDHVATIRQARGTTYPSPVEAARFCRDAGAHSITIHLREDRRHIQDQDVDRMIRELDIPVNLEMACVDEVVLLAERTRPAEACLVPERRQELTTEGGLAVVSQVARITETVKRLQGAGIIVSLFVDPDSDQLSAAAATGAQVIELHTGTFCDAGGHPAAAELDRLVAGAHEGHRLGLQVNAGHGIHLQNIHAILEIPHLDTLNIGHSIISRAVMVGMHAAVCEMLIACGRYQGGRQISGKRTEGSKS